MKVANRMDAVSREGRELARAEFVLAAADVGRCPFNPAASKRLARELGALTADEVRHYGYQYREELHALGAAAEVAAMKARARARP